MSLVLVGGLISRSGKVGEVYVGHEALEGRSFQIIVKFGFHSFILLIHLGLYLFYLAQYFGESVVGHI